MALVRQTVLAQLIEVAKEVLGVDPAIVSEESSFKDDLDADSLDLVEVVMALEERFSISVPEEKLDSITTVGEAVDLVMAIASEEPVPAAAAEPVPAVAAAPAETAERAGAENGKPAAASAAAPASATTAEPEPADHV